MLNRARAAVPLLCAIPVVALACSFDDAPARPPIDEAGFVEAVVQAFCDSLDTCCAIHEPPYKFVRKECERSFRAAASSQYLASPGARFSQTSAERCLSNIRAGVSTCSAIQLAPCDHVYTGTVALGEACEQGHDCVHVPGQVETCTLGVCKAQVRGYLGDSCVHTCLNDGNCQDFDGTGFDVADPTVVTWTDCFGSDHLVCLEQTCQLAPGAGSPCFQGTVCAEGLVCEAVAGTCEGLPSACKACGANEFCTDANSCEARRPTGQRCLTDQYCSSGLCEAATLTCAEAQTIGSSHGTELECLGRTHF